MRTPLRVAVALPAVFLPGLLRAAANEGLSTAAPLPSSPVDIRIPAAIVSSDRCFQIAAAGASQAFRLPVLTFCDTFRRNFLREARLELPPPAHPVTVYLGDATNDTRVLRARVSLASAGRPRERIEVPDPEHADLNALRCALARIFAEDWEYSVAPADAQAAPASAPDWFLYGLARHIGNTTRGEDFDLVYAQWSRGRLPPVSEWLAAEPRPALSHPAVAAVLAAWILDRPGKPVAELLRGLAAGHPWSGEQAVRALRGGDDPGGLNESWDAWLTAGARAVRQLGVTPPAVVARFRSQLLVYPADTGAPVPQSWRGRTLSECVDAAPDASMRDAARNRAMRIRLFAAGRDATLRRVADAYGVVLDGIAAGVAPEKLRVLLLQAEEMRKDMERRAAAGETLRDAAPDTPPERRKQERFQGDTR